MIERILIADDDFYYRDMLVNMFILNSCEISIALDQNIVLELLSKSNYDLVIIDFDLPGRPISEVLTLLKDHNGGTSIIIVTADHSLETEVAVRIAPGDFCFVKPFEASDMQDVLKRLTRKREQKRNLIENK